MLNSPKQLRRRNCGPGGEPRLAAAPCATATTRAPLLAQIFHGGSCGRLCGDAWSAPRTDNSYHSPRRRATARLPWAAALNTSSSLARRSMARPLTALAGGANWARVPGTRSANNSAKIERKAQENRDNGTGNADEQQRLFCEMDRAREAAENNRERGAQVERRRKTERKVHISSSSGPNKCSALRWAIRWRYEHDAERQPARLSRCECIE